MRTVSACLWTLAMLVGVSQSAFANTYLDQARTAYKNLAYDEVAPLLTRALEVSTAPDEKVQIYELLATMHVMYDHAGMARDAFEAILALDPSYQPPAGSSPKLVAAFDDARAHVPAAAPPPPVIDTPAPPVEPVAATTPPLEATTPGPAAEPAFYQQWWFWAGLGVVAASATAGIWYGSRPTPPKADFGPLKMP